MSMMNYFSLGCGRSTEVKDAPPFTTAKLFFNRIVHQMRSNKGEAHGQTRNEFLPHYMSPSLSRRYILSVVVKSGQLLREGAIDQVNCFSPGGQLHPGPVAHQFCAPPNFTACRTLHRAHAARSFCCCCAGATTKMSRFCLCARRHPTLAATLSFLPA